LHRLSSPATSGNHCQASRRNLGFSEPELRKKIRTKTNERGCAKTAKECWELSAAAKMLTTIEDDVLSDLSATWN